MGEESKGCATLPRPSLIGPAISSNSLGRGSRPITEHLCRDSQGLLALFTGYCWARRASFSLFSRHQRSTARPSKPLACLLSINDPILCFFSRRPWVSWSAPSSTIVASEIDGAMPDTDLFVFSCSCINPTLRPSHRDEIGIDASRLSRGPRRVPVTQDFTYIVPKRLFGSLE